MLFCFLAESHAMSVLIKWLSEEGMVMNELQCKGNCYLNTPMCLHALIWEITATVPPTGLNEWP
jgi:hypothetical protein